MVVFLMGTGVVVAVVFAEWDVVLGGFSRELAKAYNKYLAIDLYFGLNELTLMSDKSQDLTSSLERDLK